ncbi:hypothetical protein [Leifsonia sp. Root4]|uniref:hypothetical protein n=1 Tax=Leifsonia sp. Root4 TaxID=1736525 RepID=UPI000AC4C509|nr:hypothetical protein [Leifsonia sp. Root4]
MSAWDGNGYTQAPPEPFVTVLHFDYPRPPIAANDRTHWAHKARLTKQVRAKTAELAKRIPELGRIRVSLVWVVKDRRRRDGGENITPTLKPMIDGLVDAGIVEDDTQEQVTRDMPLIEYRAGAVAHMELRIEEIR